MHKPLSEMSLEELWQLFPIILTKHQDCWNKWYEEEKIMLLHALEEKGITQINHIGSTAIDGIWAKPIIDIIVEINPNIIMGDIKEILLKNGYRFMSESKGRVSLNKGYTETGFAEKVFHLHLRYVGDNDELYFRDYLKNNPTAAREYEELKLSLWKQYEYNRDGYTNAKEDFIHRNTKKAKYEYKDLY
jgi:GrpB-like predicted nucleotidyltransferase (UPF0157 family)